MGTQTAAKKGGSKTAAKGSAGKADPRKRPSRAKGAAQKSEAAAGKANEVPAGHLSPQAQIPQQQAQASHEKKKETFDKLNIPVGYQGVNPHENNPDMRTAIGNETARKALA